ncbi:hypothetical protein [Myceligenerans xiligouense]|uniref:Uncharacterized protein n=1 Tax=Myceligenerans xiligouense TaxID=253184 RepID=A0A3N4YKP4_9MICO|nr:hypothetical protein [Myceligenerans xiligouense]RPF19884.1 hypothetical protein EDD34_0451 [Myceligenerans xiligouense]
MSDIEKFARTVRKVAAVGASTRSWSTKRSAVEELYARMEQYNRVLGRHREVFAVAEQITKLLEPHACAAERHLSAVVAATKPLTDHVFHHMQQFNRMIECQWGGAAVTRAFSGVPERPARVVERQSSASTAVRALTDQRPTSKADLLGSPRVAARPTGSVVRSTRIAPVTGATKPHSVVGGSGGGRGAGGGRGPGGPADHGGQDGAEGGALSRQDIWSRRAELRREIYAVITILLMLFELVWSVRSASAAPGVATIDDVIEATGGNATVAGDTVTDVTINNETNVTNVYIADPPTCQGLSTLLPATPGQVEELPSPGPTTAPDDASGS